MTVNARITLFSDVEWQAALARMKGAVGAWQDLDGMHLAVPLPARCPHTSLLWATRRTAPPEALHLFRLRLDDGRAVAGSELVLGPGAGHGEPVEVEVHEAAPAWGADDRVGPAGATRPTWRVVETMEVVPLVFVDLSERRAGLS